MNASRLASLDLTDDKVANIKSRFCTCNHCEQNAALREVIHFIGVEALTGILMCGFSTGLFFAVFAKLFWPEPERLPTWLNQ